MKQIVAKSICFKLSHHFSANISFCYVPFHENQLNPAQLLHEKELAYYRSLQFDRRKKSFMLGRYAAKTAIYELVGNERHSHVLIDWGVLNQPIVIHPTQKNIHISLTHCDDLGGAIAFPEFIPMGLDIERIDAKRLRTLGIQMTERERDLVPESLLPHITMLTLLWTAKESLSKILKTGLTIPLQLLEIGEITPCGKGFISRYRNFPQYDAVSFVFDYYVCSITYPRQQEFPFKELENFIAQVKEHIEFESINPFSEDV